MLRSGLYINNLRRGFICMLLALFMVNLNVSPVASSTAITDVTKANNEVEFIYNSANFSNSVYQMKVFSSLVWDVDGGRESKKNLERVWGWSTCKDGEGTDVYHYTVAQYETLTGSPRASSGRIWGTGKVWAYSNWVLGTNAIALNAKVYYGL